MRSASRCRRRSFTILSIVRKNITTTEGKRRGSQPRCLVILTFVVCMLAIGLECASAEECDYKTCGALMARDASVSWAGSGPHDYSPDTKRACAEFSACVRRAKNNSAGRAVTTPAAGSSSLKSSSKRLSNSLKTGTSGQAGQGHAISLPNRTPRVCHSR
jgi:hypothetical protein